MSRTYTITSSDIGKIKTIYGTAKKIYVDDYGQLHVECNEERLNNIKVFAGPIIENNYPTVYKNLYLSEKYLDKNNSGNIMITAGGLIIEKNGRITM